MNDEQEDEDFADAFSTINPATATTDTTRSTGSGQRHSGPLSIEDFVAFPPNNTFIYLPCREPWNAAALDAILPMQQDLDPTGSRFVAWARRSWSRRPNGCSSTGDASRCHIGRASRCSSVIS